MHVWDQVRTREGTDALAAHLTARGLIDPHDLNSRAWVAGLHQVPRHLFIPPTAYAAAYQPGESSRPIDRQADPAGWWRAAYSDFSIITQRDDGQRDPADTGGAPTCSLSAPSIVLPMLSLLDVADHHTVLDIATGTGWTAAMLACRLGDDQVVTVEVDPVLAQIAAANLKRAGRDPGLVNGDGADGVPGAAPYDRIHVTCGVRTVPYAWVEQTRPGGRIVLPYMPAPTAHYGGQQLVLTVGDDGTAVGRFHGPAAFMMLRAQRRTVSEQAGHSEALTTTRFDPRTLAEPPGGLMLMLAAVAGDIVTATERVRRGAAWSHVTRLEDLAGTSWAAVETVPGQVDAEVVQAGDRRLWDEVMAAYMAWLRAGQPGPDRFGLSVSPEGQEVWLDHPGRALTPLYGPLAN
ncbi:methyltransferase domain-containing protein [Spongiactinospora sp. TRM90649]|uniref:methyltransferase domain-containing protein n=1 Tax=Spongiactinospora sp. TRM90649 TaxID=3031114 RepID=UPI0023F7607C|nr:methyltransferase domain-containing protein [Spongiactinospora sp. TRM90649]MDF5751102.1 rRNA adenine N-6-methyltransferase family protein [Spongiactinospora sp. TRM90649]